MMQLQNNSRGKNLLESPVSDFISPPLFITGTDPSPRGSADSNGAASTGTGVSANNGLKAAATSTSAAPAAAVTTTVTTNVSGIPGGGGSGSRRPSLSNEVLNHVSSPESKATVSEVVEQVMKKVEQI